VNARTFAVSSMDTVTYGIGALDLLPHLVAETGRRRVMAVMSGSLVGGLVEERLQRVLGDTLVASYAKTRQHVPQDSVLEAAAVAREAGADVVVSLGGGTPIDCAKAVTLCLAQNIESREQLDAYRVKFTYPSTYDVPDVPADLAPHIAIPTTLSGGEHTGMFGVTNDETHLKGSYIHKKYMPTAVVLDPDVTAGTPDWLWAASGVRALDHAVEGILSRRSMPFADALSLEALRLLSSNLAHSSANPDDQAARTECLLATWLSIFALPQVGVGLSHGIGHQLASQFDMIHGVTSAVMLPHVMEFNAGHTTAKLARIAQALGTDLGDLNDDAAGRAAVTAVRDLIGSLPVPSTISAAGGRREELPKVAARVMGDPAVAASPRTVTEADVLQMLDAAW
jgi:alcohol dehydrogenase class IV